ncbi:hypothetical protein ABW636_21345 [Aquimarina sp. 2201CG1-2-11]|uniref:hypothetical protein n=1 Tax=Aquimarina discodermiae TaxID=3231043 RepID=UPI00346234A7
MKTTTIIILMLGSLLLTSYEASDTKTEPTKESITEGFLSTTGESDDIVNYSNKEIITPVLQMHFDNSVTKEEAFIRFNKQVETYTDISIGPVYGTSKEWFYQIWINTGSQTNAKTNGIIHLSVYFNTDRGGKHTSYINLNNPNYDRECGWDAYLIKTNISNQPLSWVEVKHAHIRLKGTDGWFVKHFYVYVQNIDQTMPSLEHTTIISNPNRWLDNTIADGWDYYHTGNIGVNRLNF